MFIKPIVSFLAGSLSNMMTSAVLYGIVFIALADRVLPILEAAR